MLYKISERKAGTIPWIGLWIWAFYESNRAGGGLWVGEFDQPGASDRCAAIVFAVQRLDDRGDYAQCEEEAAKRRGAGIEYANHDVVVQDFWGLDAAVFVVFAAALDRGAVGVAAFELDGRCRARGGPAFQAVTITSMDQAR